MKIAFFTDTYLPQVNGVASSMGLLNDKFLELGHQVTVFTPKIKESNGDSDNVVRIKSVKVNKNPPFYMGFPCSPYTVNLLREENIEIIHAHTPLTMGILAYRSARRLKKPLVFTYHTMLSDYVHYTGWLAKTSLADQLAKYVDIFSCNVCDLVIAPSLKVKKFLQGRGVTTPIEVVPNGINLSRFGCADQGYLRSRPDFEETDKILLFVGRLGEEKNPSFLIRALKQLLPRKEGVKLVFAGSGYLMPELKQLARELGVQANVTFLGNVPFEDMPALYADVDIFVSAATSEVHPIALLEALASRLPVVAVNDPAFASTVVDGKNGFLTPLDEEIFVNKLLDILQNPAMQQNMAEQSVEISRQFSVETQAHTLLELYTGLLTHSVA